MRELFGADPIGPAADRDRADRRQVRLPRPYCGGLAGRLSGTVGTAVNRGAGAASVARRNDLRKRLRENREKRDFIWSMMRCSSSESQTSARPFSEKIPFVLMIGCTTTASKVPAGTDTRSRRSTLIRTGLRSSRKYRSNVYSLPTSSGIVRRKYRNDPSSSGLSTVGNSAPFAST